MKERRYKIHQTMFKGLMGQSLVFVSKKWNKIRDEKKK